MGRQVFVAFLRGINVGGKNQVSMTDLTKSFLQLGFSEVSTYINSGNVIFNSHGFTNEELQKMIETSIAYLFSNPISVVVRSSQEIQSTIDHIPIDWLNVDDRKYNVIFLLSSIDGSDIIKHFVLQPNLETLAYAPGVLFWASSASGWSQTTMSKLNQMPISKSMTIRNVNTVRKVFALMSSSN